MHGISSRPNLSRLCDYVLLETVFIKSYNTFIQPNLKHFGNLISKPSVGMTICTVNSCNLFGSVLIPAAVHGALGCTVLYWLYLYARWTL